MSYRKTSSHLVVFLISLLLSGCAQSKLISFDGANSIKYIEKQIEYGPRIPGSDGSNAVRELIRTELESTGWEVENQNFIFDHKDLTNIIAKSSNNPPKIIIGAHYDTRAISDNESSPSQQVTTTRTYWKSIPS